MGTLGPEPFGACVWYPQTGTLCQWGVAYYFCTRSHPPNHKEDALPLASPTSDFRAEFPVMQPVWGGPRCESREASGEGFSTLGCVLPFASI